MEKPVYERFIGTTAEGFEIRFRAYPEDTLLNDVFDDEHETEDLNLRILRGELKYFIANVVVSASGFEVGSEWLGCCLYRSYDEFCIEKDGYYDDMLRSAIIEAKENIKRIASYCPHMEKEDERI